MLPWENLNFLNVRSAVFWHSGRLFELLQMPSLEAFFWCPPPLKRNIFFFWPPSPPPSNPTSFPTWQKKNNTLFECQCIQHESTNSGHYINYVSYWSRERHFTLYPKLQESLAVYKAKPIFSFLSYFTKSLRIDRTRDHPLWSWMSIVLWKQGGGCMLSRHNISRTIFWAAGRSIR